jgi:(p)ppGpp synthase/HD superfamily hydrolase
MTYNIQTLYRQAIKFAAERHGDQKIPGSEIPYVVHLSNVCMEILFAAQTSLRRIKQQSKEVWADRITNLQPPPAHWTQEKINQCREEAQIIYTELKDGNAYLAKGLKSEISKYGIHNAV